MNETIEKQQIITLILDDDPTIEEFFNRLFNQEKVYKVTCFRNPHEFRAAITNEVKLVLLDISLPGYNDYNIFDMVSYLHKFFPGIYIIIVSGYIDLPIMKKFLRHGVFDIIDKNDQSWHEDLNLALSRVTPKILFKMSAILNTSSK